MTDVPALRAQLETLAAAGEHAQVISTLFELLERVMRDHSDLAVRYTSLLRGMSRLPAGDRHGGTVRPQPIDQERRVGAPRLPRILRT